MLPVDAQHMDCIVCTVEHSMSHCSCKAWDFSPQHYVVLLSSCVCNLRKTEEAKKQTTKTTAPLLCLLTSILHAALKS